MTDSRERAIEFHRLYDQPILMRPTVPADERVRFRARIILEEALETFEALFDAASLVEVPGPAEGFLETAVPARLLLQMARKDLSLLIDRARVDVHMPGLADGLGDLDVVVEGTRLEFGLDGEPIADAIHAANMRKGWPCEACHGTGQDLDIGEPTACKPCKGAGRVVRKRADGKVLKPEDWSPPDIAGVLRRQGWDGT